jgi:phenylacetate-coenzyme A ligase PaaK-like adenylate-forming protein
MEKKIKYSLPVECLVTEEMLPVLPFDVPPFGLAKEEKQKMLLPVLSQLTSHHYLRCERYKNVIDALFGGIKEYRSLDDIPFIPVSIFKQFEMRSVSSNSVIKVLMSSGTTGQQVSRIYLDGFTARAQGSVLIKIMQHCLGKKRIPMLVLDSEKTVKDRRSFSARGAGILGMMQFGYRPFYAFDDSMTIRFEELMTYLEQFDPKEPVFLFGFTFMVWQHFVRALEESKRKISLPSGILVHSGGWKKLQDQAVSPSEFRERLAKVTGITSSFNFYGMVEQVGSIFLENPDHYLHASIFGDVIIRDPFTLKPLPQGEPGLIQVVSMLPWSYPGHSLLTEDIGILRGEDSSQLEMKGRFFEVLGRVPRAEVRGCSDTYKFN